MTSTSRAWITAGVAIVSSGFVVTTLTSPTLPDVRVAPVQLTSGETDPISDLAGLAPGLEASSPDIAISVDGVSLLQEGDASATSGTGDFAVAFGDNAHATATGGMFDTAFADGANTTATAGFGNFDDADVFNSESPASLFGGGDAVAEYGNGDTAITLGDNTATAGGLGESALGNSDLAAVLSGDLAHATATGGSELVDILPNVFPDLVGLLG